MPVAFDAVGPSSSGQTSATSPLAWTHTAGATANAIIVAVNFDAVSAGGQTMSMAATCNSVAMTSLGFIDTFGSVSGTALTGGWIQAWIATNVVPGSNSVSVSASGGTINTLVGGSLSFSGYGGHGTPLVAFLATSPASLATYTITGVAATSIVAAFMAQGNGADTQVTGTSRFQDSSSTASTTGTINGATSTGTGSVAFSWNVGATTVSSCCVAVELRGPAAGPPPPYFPVAPGWFPGADSVTTEPYGIPFCQAPPPVADPGAPTAPVPFPPALPYQAPLLPPGWFPGADRVTTEPGGVPFWSQPLPVTDPGAVIVLLPEAAGIPDWLPLPPGWFPGASQVTTDPGSIPFYSLPQPQIPAVPPPPLPYIAGLAGTPGPGWFTDQHGQPRLWVATETWCLPVRAGEWNGGLWQLDYDNFFTDRAAQGVTVTMTDPHQANNGLVAPFLNGSTWDGLNPFTSPGVLNDAFWRRIDYMMASALRNGITIGFVFNIGYDFVTGGPFDSWSNTNFLAYGTALGARYGGQPNLVWLFGNDIGPGGYDTNFDNILAGLRAGGANQLMAGAWWHAEYTSRYYTFDNTAATWGINNSPVDFTYSYNCGYFTIEYAYGEVANQGQAHLLPVIRGDGYFYNGGATYTTQDRAIRQEWWWCLASAARGILAESENVYLWTNAAALTAATTDWSFANCLPHITSYFQSLPQWYNLLPDLSSALVTGGRGTRTAAFASGGINYEPAFTNNYVAASKTPDGTLAVLYIPVATTVTVSTGLLAAGWTATWVDPVNAASSSAGAGPTFNSTAQGSNSQGDPDWALVFQAPPVIPAATTGSGWQPLPPGWFPGASAVQAEPAAIPFYVQPQPTDQNAPVSAAVTLTGTASAAGAGAVTDVATQIAPAAAAAAGSVTAAATQAATAAATGAGAVTGVATQIAFAAAAGAGSVTAVGASSGAATAAAAGAGSVTAVVTQIAPAAAAGAGAVTTTAVQAAGATAAGAGTAGPAPVTQIAPATAASAGAVTGVATQIATATAAGAGSVTAVGASSGAATANAAGAGAVTAVVTQAATATAAGAGAVTDVATQAAKASAAGAGAVTAAGAITGTANVAGAGVVSAVATQAATAATAGAGALAALAAQQAAAAVAGAGSVTAAGTVTAAFTVGTLTSATAAASSLTAATAPGGASGGTLTATDQRTGGPS